MNFEPHAHLLPGTRVARVLVTELFGSDAEREWNEAYLSQWGVQLPAPSAEQVPCPCYPAGTLPS